MAPELKRKKFDTNENGYIGSGENCDSVYLDYNATTPLAPSVIQVITETLTTGWGNPSSSYSCGVKAKEIIETSRQYITTMLNGNSPCEVTFMSGGTEANNHVIWNALKYFEEWNASAQNTSPGDRLLGGKPHVVTTVVEHDSILCPLRRLEEEGTIDVSYVPVSKELLCVDPEDILKEIRDETVLVTVMTANNETGVMQHVKEICEQVKHLNESTRSINLPQVLVHTDAAQTVGKVKVDVQDLGVDYLTVVGHKFYGPRIGALWVRSGSTFHPMLFGGGQEKGKRAGTENTSMIAGLGQAARLVNENVCEYNAHFKEICSYLRQKLSEVFGANVKFNCYNNSSNNLPNTLNVSFTGWHFRGVEILRNCKLTEASVGAACHTHAGDKPSSILLAHHVPFKDATSAIRLSVGRSTCKNDIDIVVGDLKHAIEILEQNSSK